MKGETEKINIILSNILKVGAYLGVAFMVLGLLLYRGNFLSEARALPISEAIGGLFSLDPFSLITLGLVILILTPLLRVIGAALSFLIVEKDHKYFWISTGVFVILVISIAIANQ